MSAARGKTVKDVPADTFVEALAAHFKKNDKISVPAWADIVKTAAMKQLPPTSEDWYYIRAAAIARRVYVRGASPNDLAKAFGGAKKNGVRRSHWSKASQGLCRKILQELEAIGLVAKTDKGGRRITKNGQRELDTIARQIELKGSL